jgi:transmembrane sensor
MTEKEFIAQMNAWRTGTLKGHEAVSFIAACNSGVFDELIVDAIEGHLDSGDLSNLVPATGQNRILSLLRRQYESSAGKYVHRVHLLKTAWVRYAAAIIVLFGIGAYLWNTGQKRAPASTAETSAKVVKNDIRPGSDRAVLTLSNGEQVQLNRATAETIHDGTLSIENNKGQLIYTQTDMVATNTMSTPKGGQYQLTLADGTKVWLNAASSITYPTAFTGTSREVSITGEAYFEVARNPQQPFIVKTPKDEITVLGTEFNINAYHDEASVKTSLIDGSVKISNVTLKPGQAYTNGTVVITNLEQDVAWKNGIFNVENLTVEQAMRQISRWYNVEIIYDNGPIKTRLSGKIDRNLTLMDLLQGLEGMGATFKLIENRIHVTAL